MGRRFFPAKTREKALELAETRDLGYLTPNYYKPENWVETRTKVRRRILALAKASKAKVINVTAKDFADFSKHYEA